MSILKVTVVCVLSLSERIHTTVMILKESVLVIFRRHCRKHSMPLEMMEPM